MTARGDVEVAIVGGGAAGIAAARRLRSLGRDILLVEALPRLGGRALTIEHERMRLDLGCGWLHSAERNPFVPLAETLGFAVDRTAGAWNSQLADLGFARTDQFEAWEAYRRFKRRLHDLPPESDLASDACEPRCRWRAFLDGISNVLTGDELAKVSARDLDTYHQAASEENWRLPEGYGTLVAALGAGIPTALATSVNAVRQHDEILVETDKGQIKAKALVVAVSTAVLTSGAIRFDPEPVDHLHAASRLPLGLANKVMFTLDPSDALPPETHLLGSPHKAETGSYYCRPLGRPLIEGFIGGRIARELEAEGTVAAAAFCREELTALLGRDFLRALRPAVTTQWGRETTIGGSYSYAMPGQAYQRAVLARPVNERLCFAGEACSASDFSTAHGAWRSGIEAAEWIDSFLATEKRPA